MSDFLNSIPKVIVWGVVILIIVARVYVAFRGPTSPTDKDTTPASPPPGGDTHV